MVRGAYPSGRPTGHRGTINRITVLVTPLTRNRDNMPLLPRRDDGTAYHRMTLRWWTDVWASPMAPEYTDPDIHGLFRLALLVDEWWKADVNTVRMALAAEIRLSSTLFGLTPLDRSRLRWEIDKGDEAGKRIKARREAEQAAPAASGSDPRRAYG